MDIILLHGALGSSSQLKQLSYILKENHQTHLLNLPGHGGLSFPSEFSIQIFANYVLDYIKVNNLEQVAIFGYSMGGYVGLYLSTYYPLLKVVTLGTKFNWTPKTASEEIKLLNPDIIENRFPAFAKQLQDIHGTSWKLVLSKTASMMQELGNNPPLNNQTFGLIKTNVQILVGDKDKMVSILESEMAAALIKGSKLEILSDTGHPIEKVNPEIIANQFK